MQSGRISLWFDLTINGGVTDTNTFVYSKPPSDAVLKFRHTGGGSSVHHIVVAELIVHDIYLGFHEQGLGITMARPRWEWRPRKTANSLTYPLPKPWSTPVHGFWKWDKYTNVRQKQKPFVALLLGGRKVGAVTEIEPNNFAGYDPKTVGSYNFRGDTGFWTINDGSFRLSGTWRFINIMRS